MMVHWIRLKLVTIDVLAVNDMPVISKASSLQGIEDEPIIITYSLLGNITDANDIDGDVIVYNISKVLSGELTVNGVEVDGVKLNKGQEAIWQPGLDVNGDRKPIFELSVLDQVSESESAVIVYADIESVADNPVIIWSKPDDITYGVNLNETQLNAEISSNIQGAFVYFPENGTKLNAGANQEIKAIFTPEDTGNYNIVEATRYISVKQANPEISWQSPAPVESGTLVGGDQLNATSNVPGVFVYEPAAGEALTLNEGESYSSYQLKTTFTPDDSVNYSTASKSVAINVIPLAPENAAPTILFSSDSATRVTNESIEFNVTAIGAKPLSYQWYKDGEPIDGENNSVLLIDSLVSASAGTYLVKISNDLGSVDSSEMGLTVLVPPAIIGDMISVEQLSGHLQVEFWKFQEQSHSPMFGIKMD